jgi:hypothetical protein
LFITSSPPPSEQPDTVEEDNDEEDKDEDEEDKEGEGEDKISLPPVPVSFISH